MRHVHLQLPLADPSIRLLHSSTPSLILSFRRGGAKEADRKSERRFDRWERNELSHRTKTEDTMVLLLQLPHTESVSRKFGALT